MFPFPVPRLALGATGSPSPLTHRSTRSAPTCFSLCLSFNSLAHFCEHMLFLGTSSYPEEASYKHYLSHNSGSSNAFTSLAETNYYFDISPAGLPGALSRHGQFFTSPLFDASCTEREVNAVHSEQSRNLQLDARRLFQLGKATSSRGQGSRYWKFGTGNKETLWEGPRKRGVDGEFARFGDEMVGGR